MTFAGVLRAVVRRWWIPVFIALVAVAAVFAITPTAKAAQVQYTAKTILVPNPSASSGTPNLQEAALEVTVGSVPATAAAALHYQGNPAVLAAQVNATVDPNVGTLTIESSGADGSRVASIANEFATALNSSLAKQATETYQSQVASVENRLKVLQAQVDQYRNATDPIGQAKLGSAEDQYRLAYDQFQQLAAQGQPTQPFTVLQKAVPVPSGGNHLPRSRTERSAIGGVVGLLIGAAIAVIIDMLWPRINSREEAEREFGTVVLAEVPKLARRYHLRRGSHMETGRKMASFREAYRMLRTSILLIGGAEGHNEDDEQGRGPQFAGPQVILVSSPLPREGKSTTVASLAVSMAETGRKVLICNADFRAPQVQKAFDLDPGPGLSDLLSGKEGMSRLGDLVHPTSVPGVSFVHSGSEMDDAAELIARRGAELLEEARSIADVVLLDTAPLLVVSDASELLPAVDAVVMVARAGQTSRDGARRSYELLARAGIPVLGVVLIGASSPMSYYYYGGRYGAPRDAGWKRWLRRSSHQRIVPAGPQRARPVDATWAGPTPGAELDDMVPNGSHVNGARAHDGEGRRGGSQPGTPQDPGQTPVAVKPHQGES